MSTPKISVIVPVYKAELYLSACIDSILAQTFTDFELLLIDDGSPDASGQICDEYAGRDSRVRVFHKENGGVSSARQYGLDRSRGFYVIHADPDDWVEPDMLESLYGEAEKTKADMVLCDFIIEDTSNHSAYISQKPKALNSRELLKQLLFQQLHGSCCNKLVKRACYKQWNVKFPKGVDLWEDLWVNCSLLLHEMKIAYIGKAFYHYDTHQNSNSIVRNVRKKDAEGQIAFCLHFKNLLADDEDIIRNYLWKTQASVKMLLFRSRYYSGKEIIDFASEINTRFILEYGGHLSIKHSVPYCVSLLLKHPKWEKWAFFLDWLIRLQLYPLCSKVKSLIKR